MLKRLFSILTISLVLTGSFFSVYNIKYPVYADTTTDEWTQVTNNQQLVDAFKYYCKSRDVTIEGSVADAVTSFTTKTFNGIVNTLGIDVNVLQANLKYQTDGNLGTRFLFNSLSIDAYNRIFAQFLQDNDLEVGDENVDKEIYSGAYVVDSNGNGAFAYVIYEADQGTRKSYTYNKSNGNYGQGSDYIYSPSTLPKNSTFNYEAKINNVDFKMQSSISASAVRIQHSINNGSFLNTPQAIYYPNSYTGAPTFVYNTTSKNLYAGAYKLEGVYIVIMTTCQINGVYQNADQYNTNINIVSNTINNNTYEGDTVINNNGDTNIYPDNPDNPDTPDPPTIPDSGGWQDFSLPEMPNDWLIYGMEKKFPFDIPFNIMFALSLLNHEPEIPKFEGDIDLQVCTWHYDIDLTPFDDIATILRRFEVLAFIIGLAILTKELINWG